MGCQGCIFCQKRLRLSRKVDECKPLPEAQEEVEVEVQAEDWGDCRNAPGIRGLHSSTLQLNLSAFCVTGDAVRGCFGAVLGVVGGIAVFRVCFFCQKRLKLS